MRYHLPMILNVSLTHHIEEFVDQAVTSRSHQFASKVARTAACLEEPERQANLLREHIQKGKNNSLASIRVSESRMTVGARLRYPPLSSATTASGGRGFARPMPMHQAGIAPPATTSPQGTSPACSTRMFS